METGLKWNMTKMEHLQRISHYSDKDLFTFHMHITKQNHEKNLQILILLCFSLFILSCQKEAKLNRIEGTISPGMDVVQNDLANIPVVMVKIYDSIDFAKVTLDAGNFENFYTTNPDAAGYYYFDSLPDGNYLVACGEGFKFADVDYAKISATNGSNNQVNKSVNRLAFPNGIESYTVEIKNDSKCRVTHLEFFVDGISSEKRETLVGPAIYENATYGYFDFYLDKDQHPDFAISLVNKDTLVTSKNITFFDNTTNNYVCLSKTYYLVDTKRFSRELTLIKGNFFGHFIIIYDERPKATWIN